MDAMRLAVAAVRSLLLQRCQPDTATAVQQHRLPDKLPPSTHACRRIEQERSTLEALADRQWRDESVPLASIARVARPRPNDAEKLPGNRRMARARSPRLRLRDSLAKEERAT